MSEQTPKQPFESERTDPWEDLGSRDRPSRRDALIGKAVFKGVSFPEAERLADEEIRKRPEYEQPMSRRDVQREYEAQEREEERRKREAFMQRLSQGQTQYVHIDGVLHSVSSVEEYQSLGFKESEVEENQGPSQGTLF